MTERGLLIVFSGPSGLVREQFAKKFFQHRIINLNIPFL